MSKRNGRRKRKRFSPIRTASSHRRTLLIAGAALCLLSGVIALARWRSGSAAPAAPAMLPPPQASASQTPNSLVPKKAAKEFIYVGDRVQAVEETKPPVGGAAFDFTGNGSGDAVIWRPSEANWYVLDLASNTNSLQSLGASTDIIVPGDYDGDNRTDIAVWRPNAGNCLSNNCGWYIKQSSDGVTQYYADFGQAPPNGTADITVPADFDGDGKTDRAIWRPTDGSWRIIQSSSGTTRVESWGQYNDRPVPADFDGDGLADLAVFRPSEGNWYIKQSSGGTLAQGWGQSNDILAPADYDGDGKADITVFRPSEGNWYIRQSSNGTTRREGWGGSGDRVVPADYDGDGRTDIAVWRPAEGNWYVKKSSDGTTLVRNWGMSGDQPVPATYVRLP